MIVTDVIALGAGRHHGAKFFFGDRDLVPEARLGFRVSHPSLLLFFGSALVITFLPEGSHLITDLLGMRYW